MTIDQLPWRDLIDILLIGFLLQRLFLLFQRTHAVKILTAIAAIYALQLAANRAGLVLTSWFFEGLRPVLILVFVVVFRNELRDLLLKTDPLKFFIGPPGRPARLDLAALSEEVFELARLNIGALVVLRNRDSLFGHVNEGIALDSRFDPRVLRTIFLKESPIHDGAVILQGNRIARVGSILPLSLRSDLPDEYGTRHRAALGLTERTDAIVIVASEERGEVTVVHRTHIVETADPAELEATLRGLRGFDRPKLLDRSRARRAGRLLVGYVGACLIVALFSWLYFGSQRTFTTVTTKLDYQNLPESLALDYISSESVDVQLSGRKGLVETLEPEQVRVSVDLSGEAVGKAQTVRIAEDDVELPPGLEIRQITPPQITVDIVRRVRAPLEIVPRTIGPPPPGLHIEAIRVEPPTIEVVGPETVFDSDEALATSAPIDLSELDPDQTSLTRTVDVKVFPASLQPLSEEPPRAQVTVQYSRIEPPTPPEAPTEPSSNGPSG